MKKLSFLFVASMLCCGLAGCSDDKEETEPTPVYTAEVKYSIPAVGDITSVFDVTVSYSDADGTIVSEPLVSVPWTKTVKNVKVPNTIRLSLTYAKKTDYPQKGEYEFVESYAIATTLYKNGTHFGAGPEDQGSTTFTVDAADIESARDEMAADGFSTSIVLKNE